MACNKSFFSGIITAAVRLLSLLVYVSYDLFDFVYIIYSGYRTYKLFTQFWPCKANCSSIRATSVQYANTTFIVDAEIKHNLYIKNLGIML